MLLEKVEELFQPPKSKWAYPRVESQIFHLPKTLRQQALFAPTSSSILFNMSNDVVIKPREYPEREKEQQTGSI